MGDPNSSMIPAPIGDLLETRVCPDSGGSNENGSRISSVISMSEYFKLQYLYTRVAIKISMKWP